MALGRKNWIHIGSPQAGPKVAAILSVVESCRRLKLPVRDYLAAVLPGFADAPDPAPPRPYSRCVGHDCLNIVAWVLLLKDGLRIHL